MVGVHAASRVVVRVQMRVLVTVTLERAEIVNALVEAQQCLLTRVTYITKLRVSSPPEPKRKSSVAIEGVRTVWAFDLSAHAQRCMAPARRNAACREEEQGDTD